MKLEFPTAPKTYKKVKNVKVYLAKQDGTTTEYEVPIWMEPAGIPTFAVPVPLEFERAWNNHRSKEYRDFDPRLSLRSRWLHAPSFAEALGGLEKLSHNYTEHIQSINIRKVISLYLELRSPEDHISKNNPSFSNARVIVGMRSKVYWSVNGRAYLPRRGTYRVDDIEDDVAAVNPAYEDLEPTGNDHGNGVEIPYTDAAWATVMEIESTLRKAAVLLQNLTKVEDAQRLLEAGSLASMALLTAPKASDE